MWNSRVTWLALGLLGGLVIGLNVAGLWPQVAVHATATHGLDNFAIATGAVDDDVEVVYFLDGLTGDLKGAVLNLQTRHFNTFYEYNVAKDLVGPSTKNAKYLMVTGDADIRRSVGATQLGKGVVYIGELTSGKVAAYGLPWVTGRQNNMQPAGKFPLTPLDLVQFRTTAVRPE